MALNGTLLKKILVIIISTVFLCAVFTALVFSCFIYPMFTNMKAEELSPRADYIVSQTADYLQAYINVETYKKALAYEYGLWDAEVFVFDASEKLIAYPTFYQANVYNAVSKQVSRVLEGESISMMEASQVGVLIGKPVVSRLGYVIGAVFLVKPINEINAVISSMILALILTIFAISGIMLVPAYIASKNVTEPLRQMTAAARSMSEGDFSVRAKASGTVEIGQLGNALNSLSTALSQTINDLTIERNRLRSTVDGLGEGIITANAQGMKLYANPASVRLLGGGPKQDVTDLSAYRAVYACVRLALEQESVQTKQFNAGGAVLMLTATPLRDSGEQIAGAVALIQDITESVRLEQTRREYVANVSHELRTPIASIRGLADALNDKMVKNEADKARYYGYILRESIRLSRLIDDLLELSRLQSGSIAFTKSQVDVSEIIMDVSDRYGGAVRDTGRKVALELSQGPLLGFTNADRVEQVLIALLDNAFKHSEGDVTVQTEASGEKLLISVINPGVIAPEDIEHLFERFYKADKSHSGNGTGLGLSIASEIIQLLGERIWVENEDGNVKFTFTVTLANANGR